MHGLVKRRVRACPFKLRNEYRKTLSTGRVKQLLAVWNGCDVESCNVVHACGRKEAVGLLLVTWMGQHSRSMNIDFTYTFAYCLQVDNRIRRHTNKRGIEQNTNTS